MFRAVAQRSFRLQITRLPRRHVSSEGHPRGRRTGRKLFWLFTGSLATTGGVLVYASKDDKLRQLIETNVPYSKPCIDGAGRFSDVVVDYYKKISPSGGFPSSMPNISFPEFSWPQVSMPNISVPGWLKGLMPGKKSNETASSAPATQKQEQAKRSYDVLLSVAVNEIGNAVKESKEYVETICNDAINKNAIPLAPTKDEIRKKKLTKAEATIRELRDDISRALADESTTDKDYLFEIQRKLDNAVRTLNLASLEAEALKLYAQHYPENLQKELAAKKAEEAGETVLLPLENVNEVKLKDKDMNNFIAFGYRKLKALQEDLDKHDVAGKKALLTALDGQKGEAEKILAAQSASDLAVAERELRTKKAEEVLQIERKLEETHKEELAKQAAENSQHLQDVLESQERYLRSKFESSVQESLALERSKEQYELASLIARVSAVHKFLNDRAEVDRLSSKSHQLWIATQALHDELFSGDMTKEGVPVEPMLKQITSSFGDEPFVNTMVSQFANEKEVISQASLCNRFSRVRRVCRRVATVPYPGTFSAYFWSFLRSMFIIDPPSLPILVDEDGSKYINASQLDTIAILSTAQKLLDNNELELCVKLMNQLTGEARQVASDWLADARRLLELRQAANALLAFAAANSAVGFLTYQGVN